MEKGKEGRNATSVEIETMGEGEHPWKISYKNERENVAVKLSGETLTTVIALKHKLEKDRGTIVSVVEVVREAVEVMARNLNAHEEEKKGDAEGEVLK